MKRKKDYVADPQSVIGFNGAFCTHYTVHAMPDKGSFMTKVSFLFYFLAVRSIYNINKASDINLWHEIASETIQIKCIC